MIHSGEWSAGSRLPPIPQLCTRFAASTITVRQALQILHRDGLLHGGSGRGTFFVEAPPGDVPARPTEARRLGVSDPLAMGQGQTIEILSRTRPVSLPSLLSKGGEAAGNYVHVHKVHRLGMQPLAVMEMYVAATYYDLFPPGADEQRKIAHLMVDHAVPLQRYRQEITIAHADAEAAARLRLPLAGVVARLRRWWTDDTGKIALASLSQYRGDLFLLDIAIEDPGRHMAGLRPGAIQL